jgi:hypothetical protein
MVVGLITNCSISVYHHQRCEFESRSGEVYSIKHYVIEFVSDLRHVGGFLRLPMASRQKSENRDYHKHGQSSEIWKQGLPQTWPVVRNLKTGTVTNRHHNPNHNIIARPLLTKYEKLYDTSTWSKFCLLSIFAVRCQHYPIVRNLWRVDMFVTVPVFRFLKTGTTTNMASRQKLENRDYHKHGQSSEIWNQGLPQTWPVVRNL